MRFIVLMSLFVALFAVVIAQNQSDCPKICTMDYTPVCAELNGQERTFGNQCSLDAYACEAKEAWTVNRAGKC